MYKYFSEHKNNIWVQHINELLLDENRYDEEKIEFITNIFVEQLRKDLQTLESGTNEKISDCAINAPGRKSHVDKEINLAHKIAIKLFPLEENDKPLEVKKIYSSIRYSQLLSKLRTRFRKQIEDEELKKLSYKKVRLNNQRKDFCTLKNNPPSILVTEPVPMPVDVAKLEDLEPFFNYLKTNTKVNERDKEYVKFTKGVHYYDGRIDLCKQVVGSPWIQTLMDSIKDNEHIEHFLLGNNIIDITGAKAIANFISNEHKPKIKTWYLAGNRINAEGIALIAESLKKDTDANALWLKRNPLKVDGAKAIGDMLKVNTKLQILDLHNTGLLDEGVKYVFDGLMKNNTLRHLYLDANAITPDGCKYIAEYFDHLITNDIKGITNLWLDINRIDDDGTIILINSLKNYKYLRRLIIGSNRISHIGAKIVFESLVDHPNLQVLDLGLYKSTSDMGELPNNITDEGVEYIAKFIENNKTVKYLSVLHNNISNTGLLRIAEALQKNNSILCIHYEQYGLMTDSRVKKSIRYKLEQNVRNALNVDLVDFNINYLRFIKHSKKVKYIDSIYRNKM